MKKRIFKSKQEYENLVEDFISENEFDILEDLLNQTEFTSLGNLVDAERSCYFGFDCGLVSLEPTDEKMKHEWTLDNGKYRIDFLPNYPFKCQSTTLQKIQANYIKNALGLNELMIKTWID